MPPELAEAFALFRAEWNRAERSIKIAEQVEGKIVNPAIYELRYGARRVVEAFDLLPGSPNEALHRLRDAHFDCCRARHDAIDAATSKMAATIDNAREYLGVDVVMTHFAAFPNLIKRLGAVRDKIAVSRENREDRDAIYASIEADNLVELVNIYNDFRASEPLMRESAKKNRDAIVAAQTATANANRRAVIDRRIGIAGLIVGIIGIALVFIL